jgi:uncharacterized protein
MDIARTTVKKIVKEVTPFSKILLFGSRARNDAEKESDYDFLIIVPNFISIREKIFMRASIRKKLLAEGIRSDILIQSEEELECKNVIPGHIVKTIIREGIAI